MNAQTAPHGSAIERAGVRFLRSLAAQKPAVALDAVHVLNPAERAELLRIERGAVRRAAVAGALSGFVCAIPAIVMGVLPPDASTHDKAVWWAVVGAVTVVASVAEIVFLYWDGLRAVHGLAHAAGMDLTDEKQLLDPTSALWSLARAALEMPNPTDIVPGVDPLREASRLRLALTSTLYKLKVTLTGFLTKALLRRALGRAATRAVLELVAVPVTAVWDAIVCGMILREARLRVMGPSAALEFVGLLLPPESTSAVRACALRAVCTAVVRSQDLHPNLVALHKTVQATLGDATVETLDDGASFFRALKALDAGEQTTVLRVLCTASIIDGRLADDEVRLMHEAFAACGRRFSLRAVKRLRRAFVSGDPIPAERLHAVADASVT